LKGNRPPFTGRKGNQQNRTGKDGTGQAVNR
jgi:hypothetical protein